MSRTIVRLMACVCALGILAPAYAQNVWLGNNADFHDPTNWSQGQVPYKNDGLGNATINNAGVTQPVASVNLRTTPGPTGGASNSTERYTISGVGTVLTITTGGLYYDDNSDASIDDGGMLVVNGRLVGGGDGEASLNYRKRSRIGNATSSNVSTLRVEDNGVVYVKSGNNITMGAGGPAVIEVKDNGILNLAGTADQIVFSSTDPAWNKVAISGNGQVTFGAAGSIADKIADGLVVSGDAGRLLSVGGASVSLGGVVTVSLGGVGADVINGSIQDAIALANDGDAIHLVEAGDYDPFVYTGDKSLLIFGAVDGAVVSNAGTDVNTVEASATSATAAVALCFENVDIYSSPTLASGDVHAMNITQTTEALTVKFADVMVENGVSTDSVNGRGSAMRIRCEDVGGPMNFEFTDSDIITQSPGKRCVDFSAGATTFTALSFVADGSNFRVSHPNGNSGNNGVIGFPNNRRYLDVDFTFRNCEITNTNGRGLYMQGNNAMRECQVLIEDSYVLAGGGNQDAVLMQSGNVASNVGGNNSLTITRSTIDSGVTNNQSRVIRCNINGGGGNPGSITGTVTVTNSLIVTAGSGSAASPGLNANGRSTSNHSMGIGTENGVTLIARHNTIVSRNRTGWGGVWHNSDPPATVQNNIFWQFGGESGHYGNKGGFGVLANDRAAVLTLDGNVVAGYTTDSDLAPAVDDLVSTLTVFADHAGGDFSLADLSPALGDNAGTSDLGIADDINGASRPNPVGSAPDAGAYELYLVPVELGSFEIE